MLKWLVLYVMSWLKKLRKRPKRWVPMQSLVFDLKQFTNCSLILAIQVQLLSKWFFMELLLLFNTKCKLYSWPNSTLSKNPTSLNKIDFFFQNISMSFAEKKCRSKQKRKCAALSTLSASHPQKLLDKKRHGRCEGSGLISTPLKKSLICVV